MGKWKEKTGEIRREWQGKMQRKIKHDIFTRNALKILIKKLFRNLLNSSNHFRNLHLLMEKETITLNINLFIIHKPICRKKFKPDFT